MNSSRAKYVVFKEDTGNEHIVIIQNTVTHADVRVKYMQPVRAGFLTVSLDEDGNKKANCFGESISLRLRSSKEEDEKLANYTLNDGIW